MSLIEPTNESDTHCFSSFSALLFSAAWTPIQLSPLSFPLPPVAVQLTDVWLASVTSHVLLDFRMFVDPGNVFRNSCCKSVILSNLKLNEFRNCRSLTGHCYRRPFCLVGYYSKYIKIPVSCILWHGSRCKLCEWGYHKKLTYDIQFPRRDWILELSNAKRGWF
jgi:hypothetical protein